MWDKLTPINFSHFCGFSEPVAEASLSDTVTEKSVQKNIPRNKLKKNVKDKKSLKCYSVQFSSVTQSCPTLCNPMNRSTPGLPVHHQLPEFTQTHVHRVSDAIEPSHPLSSPSPPAPNPFQHESFPMSQLKGLKEGNGNPHQYSCLENSMDGGAW